MMTEMVIKRVENMVKEQKLKSCKFYDRRRNLLLADDLLEEVGGVQNVPENENENLLVDDAEDPHSVYLPNPDPEVEENLSGELSVDEIIDEQEVADLLDDAEENNGQLMELDEEGDLFQVEDPEEEHDNEELSRCEPAAAAETDEEPDLMSEPDEELTP